MNKLYKIYLCVKIMNIKYFYKKYNKKYKNMSKKELYLSPNLSS